MKLTNTNKVVDTFEQELTTRVKANLAKNKNTGALYDSFDTEFGVNGLDYTVSVIMEHYGKWVDEGRKPGIGMPVEPLKKWIKSRGLVAKDTGGKKVPMTKSRLDSLSYVINRKIREEGIDPTFFLTEPMETLFPSFTDKLAEAYAEDVIADIFG
jgi:hypothetical protein